VRPKPNLKAEEVWERSFQCSVFSRYGREVFSFQCSVFSRAIKNEHATLPFPLSGLLGGVLSFRFVSFKHPDFLHHSYLSFPVSAFRSPVSWEEF
jgi:hypothetical protein